MWISEGKLAEAGSVLPPCGYQGKSQVVRLGSKHLYLLGHFSSPRMFFFLRQALSIFVAQTILEPEIILPYTPKVLGLQVCYTTLR